MKRNPFMWAASTHSDQIHFRKVTTREREAKGYMVRATYHDTWAEAHAAVVARAEARLAKAAVELAQPQRWLKSKERALVKAKAMQQPAAPEEEGKRPC